MSSIAFWSIVVSESKPVELQPPEGYVLNVQQIALDTSKDLNNKGTSVLVKAATLSIENEQLNPVIGTLRSGTTDQINVGGWFFSLCA